MTGKVPVHMDCHRMAESIRSCLMTGHDFSVSPLLLMDGHSTHYCPEVVKEAVAQDVVEFVLPPSTTHYCTQLLDKDFAFGRNEVLMIWLH